MATYEFRCRACGSTFEERRPMAEADRPATCPDGHTDTARLLSVFTSTGGAAPVAAAPAPRSGGACCGGGCH